MEIVLHFIGLILVQINEYSLLPNGSSPKSLANKKASDKIKVFFVEGVIYSRQLYYFLKQLAAAPLASRSSIFEESWKGRKIA